MADERDRNSVQLSHNDIMTRVAGYVRVSSDEQVTNFSLENQTGYIERECEKKGWELVKLFREEGASAKTLKRPALIKCLEFCTNPKNRINFLAVYRLDRLSRETSDYLAVRKNLSKHGVELFSCNEPLGGESPVDRFLETILAASSQLDNEIRGQRAADGMKNRFMAGWANGTAPLGYKSATDDHGRLIHVYDPILFPKLKKCWHLMASGTKTLSEMTEFMKQQGIKAQRNKKYVPKQTIQNLFRNKYYVGYIASKKWGERKGNHEPMVDMDTFLTVQAVLSGRKKPIMKRLIVNEDFPVRRIVSCDVCGRGLTGAWSKGRNARFGYYFCPARCKPSIPVKKIEDALDSFLLSATPTPEALQLFTMFLHGEYDLRYKNIKENRKDAALRLNVLVESREKLARDHNRGVYKDDVYQKLDASLEREILERQIVFNESKIEGFEIDSAINFCNSFMKNLTKPYEISDAGQKRFLLGSISPDGLIFRNGVIEPASISPLFSFATKPQSSLCGSDGFSLEPIITGLQDLMRAFPDYSKQAYVYG